MWAINLYLLSRSVSPFSLKEARGEFWQGGATVPRIACIASVCMWFSSKERPRNNEGENEIFGFGHKKNGSKAKI